VGAAWRQSPYYDDAERWTILFWNDETPFRKFFDQLDLTTVLELACGHGGIPPRSRRNAAASFS
jgi:hypothetical protein